MLHASLPDVLLVGVDLSFLNDYIRLQLSVFFFQLPNSHGLLHYRPLYLFFNGLISFV